jgi:Zn-dependent protease with chaperone function
MDEASLPGTILPSAWAAIPGPRDRASFFDEQRRRRRDTWRLSAVAGLVVVAMGLGVSAILTPTAIVETLIILGFFDLFLPIPGFLSTGLEAYFNLFENIGAGFADPLRMTLGLVALLLPGTLFTFFAWRRLTRLFRRVGVGAVLLSLGAREPRTDDLEEQQLVNIVHEMAIAGGIQPPRVVLLDANVANAAAIGSSPDTATLIVSRRLLDEMDRDETQGVLAHLIGSAGNGDLGIALTIVSVFQTFGLLICFIDAPFSRTARRTLWMLLKFAFFPSTATATETEKVSDLLTHAMRPEGMDELLATLSQIEQEGVSVFRKILVGAYIFAFLPLLFFGIIARLILFMTMLFLLGPLLAFTWRSRRYLADATAVQLTRNPDGLARALVSLAERGGVIPGGQIVSHLFIIGPEAAQGRAQVKMAQQMAAMRAQRGRPTLGNLTEGMHETLQVVREYGEESAAAGQDTFEDRMNIVVSFHPPLGRRLTRLKAQGATAV